MDKKVLILKGLPGSGKSAYAKELMNAEKNWIRVSRDNLREMLYFSGFSREKEDRLVYYMKYIIVDLLREGHDVIVDNCHLDPAHIAIVHDAILFSDVKCEVEIKEMENSLDECIARDSLRPDSVGEKVIRKLHDRWLVKE
jgi:predicted kinase